MKRIRSNLVESISNHYKELGAIECHVFGSIAKNKEDAFSDIDIWVTFKDTYIENAIDRRLESYTGFGKIVLLHEMQNNYPLNGIQSAVLYEIEGELVRVDYYLCPQSTSTIMPGSKVLFDIEGIKEGDIIPETKRSPRDFSDSVTFLILTCFNSIKCIIRKTDRIDFILDEFRKKYEEKLDKNYNLPQENNFNTIDLMLRALEENSDKEQIDAIREIKLFASKVTQTYLGKK